MIPPLFEEQTENELIILQEKNYKSEKKYLLNHLRIYKGMYFLLFMIVLFFAISIGIFYFKVESFEDNKFNRVKIYHENYSAK